MSENRDLEILLSYCLDWQWAKDDLKKFYRENFIPERPAFIGSLAEYEQWGNEYNQFLEDEKELKTAINITWEKYRVAQIKTARWFPIETWLQYDSPKLGVWFVGLAVKTHTDFVFWCIPRDLIQADQLPALSSRGESALMTKRTELKRTLWYQSEIHSICCKTG
jgi:hypothetical protein